MSGQYQRVSRARASSPELEQGQWLLPTGVASDKFTFDVFAAEHESYVKDCVAFAVASASEDDVPDEVARKYEIALAAKLKSVKLARGSLPSCCAEWRALIGLVPTVVIEEEEPESLVGKSVVSCPVIVEMEVVCVDGRITLEEDGRVSIMDGEGVVHGNIKSEHARKFISAPVVPLDVSSAPPCVVAALQKMPHSSTAAFPSGSVSAVEFVEFASHFSSPSAKMLSSIDVDAAVGSPFVTVASIFLKELGAMLEGKPLGASLPVAPSALAAALSRVAASGSLDKIKDAHTVVHSVLAPSSAESLAQHPVANAMRGLCSSQEEWVRLLEMSVLVTVSEASRHAFVKAVPERMMGALERWLKRFGASRATFVGKPGNRSAESLSNMLWDMESEGPAADASARATAAGAPSAAMAGSSELAQLTSLLAGGRDDKGSEHEQAGRAALRDAAGRVCADPMALARLRTMQQFSAAKDFVNLEIAKKEERDDDVLLLISSDVADARATLKGMVADGHLNMIVTVRMGHDARVRQVIFPLKPDQPARRCSALRSIRCGGLTGLHFLHLLDEDDNSPAEEPLRALLALPVAVCKQKFGAGLTIIEKVVTLVSPFQAFESMQFFGALSDLMLSYFDKSPPSKLLCTFWLDLLKEVERPSSTFSRGGGCQGTMLNLSLKLLDDQAQVRRVFEQSLIMYLAEKASSGKKKTEESPSKARIPSEKWKAAVALLEKQIKPKKVDGVDKKPCACFFILGSCSSSKCKFLHEPADKAGAYCPAGYSPTGK